MDKILISKLRLDATIGVYDHEQRRRQPLIFDLELAIDARRGARNDRLADALDYEAVAAALTDLVQREQFALLETLAQQCAGLLLTRFNLPWLKLTLTKPAALPGTTQVAVQIERTREPDAASPS